MGLSVLTDWQAFHFFYHGSRDRLILSSIKPLVEDLWRHRLIQNFFFMRYSLGGPHVRLRLHPAAGAHEAIRQRVRARAERFFADAPSTDSLDEAAIQKINRSIQVNDEDEDGRCFTDNSVEELPFQAEITRYGGRELLPHSLDLFAVSSLNALAFLEGFHGAPAGRRLPAALSLLSHQAVGLARDVDELRDISRYAEEWSAAYARLVQRGDEAFERSAPSFIGLLRNRLRSESEETQDDDGGGATLSRASLALADAVSSVGEEARHTIKTSHLHMTANRLGVTNAEEVYLGRILTRSIEALHAQEPDLVERGLAGASKDELRTLTRQAMDSGLSAQT